MGSLQQDQAMSLWGISMGQRNGHIYVNRILRS